MIVEKATPPFSQKIAHTQQQKINKGFNYLLLTAGHL